MRLVVPMAFVTLALAGCAHHPSTATLPPAAVGPSQAVAWLPPEGGSIRVEVLGTAQVVPTDVDRNVAYRALKVRLWVANPTGQPWLVDPHEQVARVNAFGTLFPSDASARPLVIAPGQTRALDLYYPIPEPQYGSPQPQQVWLDWQVHTPSGAIAHRALFERDRSVGWTARTLL